MYTNRKEGGGAGWQGDFVEELLGQSRKRERRIEKEKRINMDASLNNINLS